MSLKMVWQHLMSLEMLWRHLMSLEMLWRHLMSLEMLWRPSFSDVFRCLFVARIKMQCMEIIAEVFLPLHCHISTLDFPPIYMTFGEVSGSECDALLGRIFLSFYITSRCWTNDNNQIRSKRRILLYVIFEPIFLLRRILSWLVQHRMRK